MFLVIGPSVLLTQDNGEDRNKHSKKIWNCRDLDKDLESLLRNLVEIRDL